MIFDSEEEYPESIVHFHEFDTFEMRQVFALLRMAERELNREITRRGRNRKELIKTRSALEHEHSDLIALIGLERIEGLLCYIVGNLVDDIDDDDSEIVNSNWVNELLSSQGVEGKPTKPAKQVNSSWVNELMKKG